MADAPEGFQAVVKGGQLASAVTRAAKCVPAKAAIPSMGHLCLRHIGDQRLEVGGTDLERAFCATLVGVAGHGQVTAPADRLVTIAGKVAAEREVIMACAGPYQPMQITQGRLKYTVPTIPAEDWPTGMIDPLAPEGETTADAVHWRGPANVLAERLAALPGALSVNSPNGMDGVAVCLGAFTLDPPPPEGVAVPEAIAGPALMATSGFCLGAIAIGDMGFPEPTEALALPDIIIPTEAVGVIQEVCKPGGEARLVITNGASLRVEVAAARMFTRLIDRQPPTWRRIIPFRFMFSLEVDSAQFLAVLNRVAVIEEALTAGKKTVRIHKVKVTLGEHEIVLRAEAANGAEMAEDAVACTVPDGMSLTDGGQPLHFFMRSSFLAWAVESLPAGQVRMLLNDPTQPIAFAHVNDGKLGNLRLIMPLLR